MRIRLTIILTALFTAVVGGMPLRSTAQINDLTLEQVDSLIRMLPSMPDDSTKAFVLTQICSNHPNTDSTLKYTQELYSLSYKTGIKWLGKAYHYLCWYCQSTGDFETAVKYGYKSLKINDSLNYKYDMALNYNALGECVVSLGDYSAASEYFHKALDILLNLNNSALITYTYRNLGIIYINYKLFEEAMTYFNEAMKIDIANNNRRQLALDYYFMAFSQLNAYEAMQDTVSIYDAKNLIEKASLIFRELQNEFHIMNSDLCQMQTYIDYAELQKPAIRQRLIDSSLVLYNEALNIADKNGFMGGHIYYFDICKAKYQMATKQYADCEKTLREIEIKALSDLANSESHLIDIYQCMVNVCTITGNYRKTIEYIEKLSYTEKRFYDNEFAANSIQQSAKDEFELEMRNRDIDARKQKLMFEEHKKQLRVIAVSACLFVVLLLGFAANLYRNNRRRQNTNIALMRQRENYKLQRSMLANANYEATSSIMYAKEIHTAIMPTREIMESIFGETLIVWNPIEIISGDFFWARQEGRYKLLAVADCTGHGIPGAFMSMLGITSLNDLVSSSDISTTTAAAILDKLRTKINFALRQNEKDGLLLDGMDIALCIIDSETMQMQYAGAYRPLTIIRGGGMLDYAPDKTHIGYEPRHMIPFTNNIIDLRSGDTIYLYTDGFANQFSHEDRGTKFSADRLRKMLRNISNKPFAEQKTIIDETMNNWRTSNLGEVCPQTDDQLLIGIRI